MRSLVRCVTLSPWMFLCCVSIMTLASMVERNRLHVHRSLPYQTNWYSTGKPAHSTNSLTFAFHSYVAINKRVVLDMPWLIDYQDTTRTWPLDPENGFIVIVPTSTHVILLQDFAKDSSMEPCIVVQAFTVPDDQRPVENGKGHFRLSHEGIFSSDETVFEIIRNSVVDPNTGAINVRLLARRIQSHGFRATCIDLTLDKPSLNNVSPITIDRHSVLIKGDVPTHDFLAFCNEYYDTSDDGYARGLFTQDHRCTPTKSSGVVKFMIDATQDHCMAVLSQFSSVEWDTTVVPPEPGSSPQDGSVLWDGVRGRLSYVDNKNSDGQAIVVVDIE